MLHKFLQVLCSAIRRKTSYLPTYSLGSLRGAIYGGKASPLIPQNYWYVMSVLVSLRGNDLTILLQVTSIGHDFYDDILMSALVIERTRTAPS
jgi:hypothetical protein